MDVALEQTHVQCHIIMGLATDSNQDGEPDSLQAKKTKRITTVMRCLVISGDNSFVTVMPVCCV